MKLGFSTWAMPGLPIDTSVRELAALGFQGVEITVIPPYSTELDTLGAAASGCASAGSTTTAGWRCRRWRGTHPCWPGGDAHAENWRRLTKAADLCVDFAGPEGPPPLNTTLGSSIDSFEQQRDLIVERTGRLTEYCAARGVVLAIEPHSGDGLRDPEECVWLLEAVGSPFLRLNFDISHFNIQGMPAEETVPLLAPLSVHTHVKDERGRIPTFDFLIPGEGEFDYVAYLREMRKAGYEGYITAEISMQVQRRPGYDPLAAAAMTYDTLDAAFREAGIERWPPADPA